MKFDEQALRAKGWSQEEIAHTASIMEKAKAHPKHKRRESTTIIAALIVIIVATAGAVWAIEPIILIANALQAKLIIGVLGVFIGLLLVKIEKDIDAIDHKHHLLISVMVPIIALTTSIVVGIVTGRAAEELSLEAHNPVLIGLFFSIGSLLPFFTHIVLQRKRT